MFALLFLPLRLFASPFKSATAAPLLASQDAFAQYLLPANSKQYMQQTLMDG